MAAGRSGEKGLVLEEKLKAYFIQAGYFALRGLPYQVDGEDVTDIDLWLYERPAAASRRRLIVDIKGKKSPKAAERVIWTSGLRSALGVDDAIVATTDKRASIRKLGKSLSLQVLDGEAIAKITKSEKLDITGHISLQALNASVRAVDSQRRSGEWRGILHDARSSMVTGIGVQSMNQNLSASSFFAEQAVLAQPGSQQALLGVRLMFLTAALAAISLDYALADQAFRSPEERKQIITNSVRFGQSDTVPSVAIVEAAIALARQYAENGAAIAKQIEYGFYEEADRIPAEIIADYLNKVSRADSLFGIARELEHVSSLAAMPGFDHLSGDAKSLVGVFLDFNGVARDKVAKAWTGRGLDQAKFKQENLGLFSEQQDAIESEAAVKKSK